MRAVFFTIVAVLAAGTAAFAQAFPPASLQVACREGRPDAAVAACSQVLSRKDLPPDARALALINRGTAYGKLRDLDGALADFEAAIRLNPRSAAAHNQRGVALRMRGEYEGAIESYTTAIRLQPQVAVHYTNRGIAHRWRRDLDAALADFRTATKLNPRSAVAHAERAVVYRLKQDHARAVADHNEAVRLAPRAWQSYSYRAYTHEDRRDFRAALEDFRKALSLSPGDQRLQRAVARVEGKLAAAGPQAAVRPDPAAQAAPSAGPRVALVIGNGRYSNAAPLANPKNDAEALSQALRAVGFADVTLKLDLSREQLAAALKDFAAKADRAEWAVIYFAGHGIEVGGNNYLVPVDARFASDRDVSFEAVTLDQMLQSVEGASRLRLVILDACRDNPFARKMTRSSATRSIGKGLGNIEPEGATLVAYAARHGQTAEDGGEGNSPFAASLVRHMQTPGLEINLVFRHVRDDVLAATGKRQEPYTYGSLPSEPFFFRTQ